MSFLARFNEIWCVDYEYNCPAGGKPQVHCLVAKEIKSQRTVRQWIDDFKDTPPFNTGGEALFVAYYASAEFSCHLNLNWPLPVNVVDLFCEFRNQTNGKQLISGNGLLGALAYFGIGSIDQAEKDDMRELAIRGAPFSEFEKGALIKYCESDVLALEKLFVKLAERLSDYSLLRGRYMKAAARIEENGTPVNLNALNVLRANWPQIQVRLIEQIDKEYGVYEGTTFKRDKFAQYLQQSNIPWPKLHSGFLDLSDETFKEMARSYPQIAPIRELRASLSKMRLESLAVGEDGRNRCMLSVFKSKTGRNQPSNSRFIFGPSAWVRSLIKPGYGRALAYINWSQQEFGIAAALSGDKKMIAAYQSGDPYLTFAKQAGAVPENATKQTHKAERNLYKACVLATQYGMGEHSLSARICQPAIVARDLLKKLRDTYSTFWD